MTGRGLVGADAVPGTVHLVGGGPGDPGLVGLRAAHLVATASVVAYDRLAPPELLDTCRPDCELVYVGKQPGRQALSQPEINELLVERAQDGEAVVRLKGGDPFVFGRGSEEAQACVAAGVAFEVVPGVTSAIAAPAYAGIPVTHRGTAPAFCVVTGHEDPAKGESQVDYDALAAFPGTLLLLMGVARIGAIARALVEAGRAATTPVALVQWGTTSRQAALTSTLERVEADVAASGISSPAVTVVGDVVDLRDELAWFERRPLYGVSVLVPRTRQQAGGLSARLRALGAEPVEAPTIAIEPTGEPEVLAAAVRELVTGGYDWVAFTSTNAVEAVWVTLEALGRDARAFARSRLAAVGPGTAEALRTYGLQADLVPEPSTARGLAQALVEQAGATPQPPRVLLPHADLAAPTLADLLRDADWHVDEVEAYRTVEVDALEPAVLERLERAEIDVLAFPSSSTARNLVTLGRGVDWSRLRVAAIGPSTAETLRGLGLRVDAVADRSDLDGLVQAVRGAAAAPPER